MLLVALTPNGKYDLDNPDDLEAAIAEQMAPFDENNVGIFGDGTRWDWWVIGGRFDGMIMGRNVLRRKELDPAEARRHREQRLREYYRAVATAYQGAKPELFGFMTGIRSGETEDEYVTRTMQSQSDISAYAFLVNKVWHEQERLGWWGVPAQTESKAQDKDEHSVFENPEAGAKIISWKDSPTFREKFYERFIEKLDPDTLLVVVDYHV